MALVMTGEYALPQKREVVWKALNDPAVLEKAIPGCETLEKTSDNGFAATVTLTDEGDGFKLVYTAEAATGVKIAQLGQRHIAGSANKTADQFFDNFFAALQDYK